MYIFFDAGGTLIDLDYSYLRKLLRAKGNETDESLLAFAEGKARAWVDRTLRGSDKKPVDLWKSYFNIIFREAGAEDGSMEDVIEHLWERNAEEGLWKTPIRGVMEILDELKNRGFPMSVISNAHGRVANDLRDAGLVSYFEYIFDSHWMGVEKPNPEIFRQAMKKVHATPSESLYVGDVYAIDIVGAKSAGMDAFLIDRYSLVDDVDCPKIKHISDLLDILTK
ncbi:MAG: HAD family hydrolase [Acidobacteriota bacterium]